MTAPAPSLVWRGAPATALASTLASSFARSSAMWGWDSRWASQASWADGRICLAGAARKMNYLVGDRCGGDPACNWGMWSAGTSCTAEAFENVMFQNVRYAWAQQELTRLLANKPGSTDPRLAPAWVRWCTDVMSLVSLARWASNINAAYLPSLARYVPWWPVGRYGTHAAAAQTEILEYLHPSAKAVPTLPAGCLPHTNTWLLSIVRPMDYNVTRYLNQPDDPILRPNPGQDWRENQPTSPDEVAPPTTKSHFGLRLNINPRARNTFKHGKGPFGMEWPWPVVVRGSGSSTYYTGNGEPTDVLTKWFERTITAGRGTGYWWNNNHVGADRCLGWYADYPNPSVGHWEFAGNSQLWFGTATATIRMCEAWAQDIIDTSYGSMVADGLLQFLAAFDRIPERYRALASGQIGEQIRAVVNAQFELGVSIFGAAGGLVAGAVTAVNPVAGAIVGVVVAVVSFLLELLAWTGSLAIGGGEIEAACLVPPFVRNIPDLLNPTCNFDTSDGNAPLVAQKSALVARAAASGLAPREWYRAAAALDPRGSIAAGGDDGATPPPPPPKKGTSWAPYLVAGGLIAGGVLIAKAMK